MRINDIVNRKIPPVPWTEGDSIPWHDEGFSGRILNGYYLRDMKNLDRHVVWVHEQLLHGAPGRILDLACGAGIYTAPLARLGHRCTGIDYAPAAVKHAEQQAESGTLSCTYVFADLRTADFGAGHDLVMMVEGQFNVFCRTDARELLLKACAALRPGGTLLLEPQRFEHVKKQATQSPTWWWSPGGFDAFSGRPHICLMEQFWHPDTSSSTERYFVIDADTGEVTEYAQSNEAYTEEQLRDLLQDTGFGNVRFYPSMSGTEDPDRPENLVAVAERVVNQT